MIFRILNLKSSNLKETMMMEKMKYQIGVIFGGRSSEHEVSLMSARSVLDALIPKNIPSFKLVSPMMVPGWLVRMHSKR